jgi:glycosyltransferase involved in cell wall biosynthesis
MSSLNAKRLTLSLVIPVYNEEGYIGPCLDAIAAQTEPPDEVIVVDNNSTDHTTAIAHSYPFVKVVHEKKQGIVYARDRGFDAANSNIIGRIDADTHLPKNWVERVKRFYAHPSHADHALSGGCAFYNVRLPRVDEWITSQFVFRMNRLLVGHYVLWGSNMVVPQKLWQAVRTEVCHRTDIHEDLDLAIHLHRRGYRITYRATLVVGARMGRVFENRHALWQTMMMWPRTLRVHGIKSWVFGWLGGAFLYVAQVVPRGIEIIARLFGREPIT